MHKQLRSFEGTATTTEQKQSLDVDEIILIANDDTTNDLVLAFDRHIGGNDDIQGFNSAYSLYLDCYTQFLAHIALVGDTPCHKVADEVNVPTAIVDRTELALRTATHSLKDAINAHDADASTYHYAAGTAHQITSPDPTSLASTITCLNEISGDLTAHFADDDCHGLVDTTNVITTASAKSGDLTIQQTKELYGEIGQRVRDVYFKSSASTVAFRIWGNKYCYDK